MEHVRAGIWPPITCQPLNADTVLRRSPRLLFLEGARPERRAKPLAARVPHRLPLPQNSRLPKASRYASRSHTWTLSLPTSEPILIAAGSAVEPMLNGLGASFYEGKPSTALHTDICSPVATDPTWSGLDPDEQKALEKEGGPLWHGLLEVLQPQIVTLSVAFHRLSRIQFKALSEWRVVHVFERTEAGALRKRPVEISARWCEIGGEPSLFVFVPAAQKPLGRLSSNQKRDAGEIAIEVLRRGR